LRSGLRVASGFHPTRPHGKGRGCAMPASASCSCLRLLVASNRPHKGLSPSVIHPCPTHRRRGPPGPRRLTRSEGTRKGSLDRGRAITAVHIAGEALQALGGSRGRRERARVPSTAGSPSRLARIHDAHPATGAPAARSAGLDRRRAAAAGLCISPARPSRPSAAYAVGGNAQGFPRPRARHHGSLASMTRTPPLVPPPPAPPGSAGGGRQPPLRGGPASPEVRAAARRGAPRLPLRRARRKSAGCRCFA
jgi:hypothetical protein